MSGKLLEFTAYCSKGGLKKDSVSKGSLTELSDTYNAMINPEFIKKGPELKKVKLSELLGKSGMDNLKAKDRFLGEATVIEVEFNMAANSRLSGPKSKVKTVKKTRKYITSESVEELEEKLSKLAA